MCGIGLVLEVQMKWDIVREHWLEFKGKAIIEWSQLTERELDTVDGCRNRLCKLLERRYNVSDEEASRMIDEWQQRF